MNKEKEKEKRTKELDEIEGKAKGGRRAER